MKKKYHGVELICVDDDDVLKCKACFPSASYMGRLPKQLPTDDTSKNNLFKKMLDGLKSSGQHHRTEQAIFAYLNKQFGLAWEANDRNYAGLNKDLHDSIHTHISQEKSFTTNNTSYFRDGIVCTPDSIIWDAKIVLEVTTISKDAPTYSSEKKWQCKAMKYVFKEFLCLLAVYSASNTTKAQIELVTLSDDEQQILELKVDVQKQVLAINLADKSFKPAISLHSILFPKERFVSGNKSK
jgi:hypothetical protein